MSQFFKGNRFIRFAFYCFVATFFLTLSSCAFFSKKAEVTVSDNHERPFASKVAIGLLSSVLQQNDIAQLVAQSRSVTDANRMCLEVFNLSDDRLQHVSFDDNADYENNINYLKHQRAICYNLENSVAGLKHYFAKILFTSRYVSVKNFSDVCHSLVQKGVTDNVACMQCLSDTRERSLSCLFKDLHGSNSN